MIPVIASFVLAPMDDKKPDVESVLRDFRNCLNTFDEWAESFWSGSALEVEQVFKVGEEVALVAPASSKKSIRTVAVCKAQGALTLVHLFESTRFVPIGNTPVMLQAIAQDDSPMGAPIPHTIGPSGILEVKDCTRDQRYQITQSTYDKQYIGLADELCVLSQRIAKNATEAAAGKAADPAAKPVGLATHFAGRNLRKTCCH